MPGSAFLSLPDADGYSLAGCTVPGLFLDPPATADRIMDVAVQGGAIRSVTPPGQGPSGLPVIECRPG